MTDLGGERFGPYELRSLLGRGGMGEVYRAINTRQNRGVVALKRLPAGLATDADFQRRFLREAELAARLRDPHVIPIHDYGQISDQPYLDMRLVDGIDLATYLRDHGPLSPHRAAGIVTQVASALDAAHREGLVHRDVKPQNILLDRSYDAGRDETDFVYLIDFGIAANLLSSRQSSSVVSGTAAYMAPERFTAGGDHRVDVYALGCVLHQLLTGQTPFGGDFMQLMYAHANSTPARPSDLVPGLPHALDDVIATALAKDPEQRQSGAGALAAGARRAVSAASEALRPPGTTHVADIRRPQGATPTEVTGSGDHGGGAESDSPSGEEKPPDRPIWSRRRVLALMGGGVAVLGAGAASTLLLAQGSEEADSGASAADEPGAPPPNTVVARASTTGAANVALSPDGRRIYVAGSTGVSVIDSSTRGVVGELAVGGFPFFLAVAPDGSRYYVTDYKGGKVTVVDTSTNTSVASLDYPGAYRLIPTRDGKTAYINRLRSGTFSVIDLERNVVARNLQPFPASDTTLHDFALAPDGRLFVTDVTSNGLVVVDPEGVVQGSIPVSGVPYSVALSPDGSRAYVTDNAAGTVAVVDTTRGVLVRVIPVDRNPTVASVSPDGSRVLVTSATAGTATLLDTARGAVTATIPVGPSPYGSAFGRSGRDAYVATSAWTAVVRYG